MLEESVAVMEKKGASRQSSTLAKSNGSFERKSEPTGAKGYGRYNKKRENASARGSQPDFSTRRPVPQKTRSALDKRPRQRGGLDYRQREEVAGTEAFYTDSYFTHDGGSKNLNHLLNFQYAPRDKVVGSSQQPYGRRRRVARVAYNKERYLQANCQFVVKDSGDYTVQATNPDALVDWDLVEQVRTFSHEEAMCPICLQIPAAGKITKCGHVYCWACILHYLTLDDKSWRKCPICYEAVHESDLRSVKVLEKKEQKVGDTITFHLMKRERNSTYAVPLDQWADRHGSPQNIHDEVNIEFAKVLVASVQQIQTSVIEEERRELQVHMALSEPSEVCFIEAAMVQLDEREATLKSKLDAVQKNTQVMEQLEGACASPSTNKDANGNPRNSNGGRPIASAEVSPLPKSLSFDGSKIRKQYADAFDEMEDAEEDAEEESVMSGDMSDIERHSDCEDDEDSLDSLLLSSPRSPDHDASQPLPIPLSRDSVSSTDDMQNSLDSCDLPAHLAAEATMTADEAVAHLNLSSPLDHHHDTDTPQPQRDRNLSKTDFYFYQASDGQQVYLHSVNARCIEKQYGSLELGPRNITAKIIDKDITFMTQNIRQRLRYLNHLPLTCEFQVVEVKLGPPIVSHQTLHCFADDLKKRAQKRQKVKRQDQRNARQQNIEEKMSYGIYPEVQLALDSTHHFPAPSERHRQSSLSDTASLASSSQPSTLELNANAAEFVPRPKSEQSRQARADPSPPESGILSFAAKLKQAAPAPRSYSQTAATTAQSGGAWGACAPAPPARRPDTDESDNEDRVPVPAYQNSFSSAIAVALETLEVKDAGEKSGTKGGKKKKKKKETMVLFSTFHR